MLIGLTGFARCGKDSAAEGLVQYRSFRRVSFADPLRELAFALDPIVDVGSYGARRRYTQLLYLDGYEQAKQCEEVRRTLQRLGVGVRDVLGEDTWVNAAMAGVGDGEDVVISDVRFPNEADAVLDRGGKVLRIQRPNFGPVNNHISETALNSRSFPIIFNNGSESALVDTVLAYVDAQR